MDILGNDKAPYAFVLLVSVLGWLLTNAVSEGRKHTILTYSAEVVMHGEQPYYQLTIENDSVELPISGVSIEITCPSDEESSNRRPCLSAGRPMTGAGIAVPQLEPPWNIAMQATNVDTTVFSFAPSIPAGASMTVLAGLAQAGVLPELYFHLEDTTPGVAGSLSPGPAPDIVRDFSFYGLIFRNYLAILTWGGGASLATLLLWPALSWRRKPRPSTRTGEEAMG